MVISKSSIMVSWDEPQGLDVQMSYKILLESSEDEVQQNKHVKQKWVIFSELAANTEYTIKVNKHCIINPLHR